MFKIGEFSRLGQVSIRMLRHYDKLGLLKPGKVDHFTGYRFYTLEQLPRLNRILALKDLGLSLEQISGLLADDLPAEQLRGMLAIKQAELHQSIADEQRRLERVAARLRHIEQEDAPPAYDVVQKELPRQVIAGIRHVVPTLDDMQAYRCNGYEELYTGLQQFGIAPDGIEMAIYHMLEYRDTDIDMEVATPIPADAFDELGGYLKNDLRIRELTFDTPLASTVHSGHVWDLPQAMVALYQWIADNGYQAGELIVEHHLAGRENDIHDFTNIVFELLIPINAR